MTQERCDLSDFPNSRTGRFSIRGNIDIFSYPTFDNVHSLQPMVELYNRRDTIKIFMIYIDKKIKAQIKEF